MDRRKSLTALLLALTLFCGLLTGAAEPREKVTAYLRPDITVTYNGDPQTLQDAAGNTLYPLSCNGTAYLPVRAVSNILGIEVDWDQAAQTVLLRDSDNDRSPVRTTGDPPPSGGAEEVTAYLTPGITVAYNGEPQILQDAVGNTICPLSYKSTIYLPIRAVGSMLGVDVDWDAAAQTILLRWTGADFGWIEANWSPAGHSYIIVKVNELPEGTSSRVSCRVSWDEGGKTRYGTSYTLTEGTWNIPLYGGSADYTVTFSLYFLACEHYLTDAEKAAYDAQSGPLTASFTAGVTDPDHVWVLSTPDVDFAHAPLTRAKALEITENCVTDAEKITAVFRWVAKNIKYDHELFDELSAWETRDRSKDPPSCAEDEANGVHTLPPDRETLGYTDQNHFDLDVVLTRGTGFCAHYAILTAAMIRSLGLPCKVVEGTLRLLDGSWPNHAWIAVRPASGTLDLAALGGGQDFPERGAGDTSQPTGWIRLDPTNGLRKPEYMAMDENYRIASHH